MLRESQKGEHSRFIWKIVEKQLQSLVCMQGIVVFKVIYQCFIPYILKFCYLIILMKYSLLTFREKIRIWKNKYMYWDLSTCTSKTFNWDLLISSININKQGSPCFASGDGASHGRNGELDPLFRDGTWGLRIFRIRKGTSVPGR